MNGFWIIFAFMGLPFGTVIFMFLLCGADLKHKIWPSVFCLVMWVFLSLGITVTNNHNESLWNGGYCECGTHWELRAASKTRNGSKTKYYACPDCHNEIELQR